MKSRQSLLHPIESAFWRLNLQLVGGLEHEFYFPFHIWDVILPIDEHIFQDGYCTTNQTIFGGFSHDHIAPGATDSMGSRILRPCIPCSSDGPKSWSLAARCCRDTWRKMLGMAGGCRFRLSMDWLNCKSTGNHRFCYEIWVFPVIFPLNQSIEVRSGDIATTLEVISCYIPMQLRLLMDIYIYITHGSFT